MEIVAALIVLVALGWFFYAIREPQKWNWPRPQGQLFWQWPREGMCWFAWGWTPTASRWKIWRVGPINYHIALYPARGL